MSKNHLDARHAAPVRGRILVQIDPDSDVAPYEQVRQGIIRLIDDGELMAGIRMPTVRALAADLRLAPNTVARAYRELETAEIIETRGRQGSFVRASRESVLHHAQELTVEFVAAVRKMGISDQQVNDMVATALRSPV